MEYEGQPKHSYQLHVRSYPTQALIETQTLKKTYKQIRPKQKSHTNISVEMVPQALMAARRQVVSQIECLRQLPMLPIGSPPTESPKHEQQSNQCTQSKPQQSIQANETTKTIKSRRKETNA